MGQDIALYRKVYNLLEDEESRDIYLDRLNFLISYKSEYMNRILSKYTSDFAPMNRVTFADILRTMPKGEDIILYGAGEFPRVSIDEWQWDKRIVGFCSNNQEKQKSGFLGYPVIAPEELWPRRDVNVLVSTTAAKDEILGLLAENGFPTERTYAFQNVAPFREDPEQYFPKDIIQLEEEVFVDAGCYDLSTSLALRERCKKVKKVYAFEPDPANFALCQARKQETNYTQAQLFCAGTWSENTELSFWADETQSSCVIASASDGGSGQPQMPESCKVPVVAIDRVVAEEDKVTFIKMDVEGAELESLKGAKETILRNKPKLAICIYHKPDDLIDIPLYINELVPEYKLYIRHHSNDGSETVLNAVI